ncbi:hypothetical protein [Prauserella muralis]|uniref:Uncharacterized protein n=1 Tax=Prauserella muralis TaxID=588067 RepID=A0A2V4AM46_9PSEU|nr:hypothetical protein [Prauserella muralis]PXY21103.1 hypothetical protein BAY60_26925 [Prauserella muralis]TWE30187.1 hypothetical protein FHX69_2884 [Prauserella muralis]
MRLLRRVVSALDEPHARIWIREDDERRRSRRLWYAVRPFLYAAGAAAIALAVVDYVNPDIWSADCSTGICVVTGGGR